MNLLGSNPFRVIPFREYYFSGTGSVRGVGSSWRPILKKVGLWLWCFSWIHVLECFKLLIYVV